MLRRLAIALAATVVLALPAAAHASPFLPPSGKVFVKTFFGFLKSHKRVRMAVYFQSANLKRAFRLSAHPRSRKALRRAVR